MNNEINDRFELLNVYTSHCPKCIFFDLEKCRCKAYPQGVPEEFLSGDNVHESIEKGQKGNFVFTPKQKKRNSKK